MDAISDELLTRIWSPKLPGGELPEQGPFVQSVSTNFSVQHIVSAAVIEDMFVTAVSVVEWSQGTPQINTTFAEVPMGTVASASDEWRENM